MSPIGTRSSGDAAALEAGFRDLTSLLALPALWSGRDERTVVETLCEALEALLPADVVYLDEAGRETGGAFRVQGRPVAAIAAWQPFLRSLERHSGAVEITESPLGTLRVARAQMAFGEPRVTLWVGSRASGFPRPTQLAYLGAAASLASSGLRTARLIAERDFGSRMKDEFLAMLGHELRNPLAGIATALQLMSLKKVPEVEHERQVMARQVSQLARLVDDLVDVARVAKGKIELRLEPVAVDKVLRAALESVQPLVEERRHVVSAEIAEGLGVRADPVRLQQIFANLLHNAAKYTERGGRIEVRTRARGGQACIEVCDDGSGIEPELLPHIFEPFTQGRRAPDRAAGGLGIGLALVRSLVRMHGGLVTAESRGAGQGSRFTVWLPLETQAAQPAPPTAETGPRRSAPLRLLVVDDNADAANTLAALLRVHGHDVLVAHDGEAAITALERFPAEIALIDIGLPGMDGRALARQVRQRLGHRAPRLIAVSGYGQPEDRARSLSAGMEAHLVKPLDVAQLLDTLGARA